MTDLLNAIENLYLTFSKYTTEGIQHCNCGCINEEYVKKLYSKPLREADEDALNYYQSSAIYTWGDIKHYKHYLPRICELRQKRNYVFVDLDEIVNKLEYAKWMEWDEAEVKAIRDYIRADWIQLVNYDNTELTLTQFEAYIYFFELKQLLDLWKITETPAALKNFVLFFYYNGNEILDKWAEIKSWIKTDKLREQLEKEYFKHEHSDAEYAEQVSVVLQMIEQQIKAG